MKRIGLILLILTLVALPLKVTFGQDAVFEEGGSVLFVGASYVNETVIPLAGYGHYIGGRLWLLTPVDLGYYGSVDGQVTAMFQPRENLFIGLFAGPSVDWSANDQASLITYLVGASGGTIAYQPWEALGFWGYGKYSFAIDTKNAYENSGSLGVGVFFRP